MTRRSCLWIAALWLPAVSAWAGEALSDRARVDYMLHCSGCHGMDGMGKPERGIPRFAGQIGYFQQLAEGRAFIMQVPGLLSARLSDERAAAVVVARGREVHDHGARRGIFALHLGQEAGVLPVDIHQGHRHEGGV